MQKGITAVIAVILLLLITIAISGFAFVFFTRTAETAAQSGEEQLGQQVAQIGTRFQIEGVDKNRVYVRNIGATPLTGLAFYVNNVQINNYSGPALLNSSQLGTYYLNDSQLAMLPDPAQLYVTSAGASDQITANFYGKYTVAYWGFDEGQGINVIDSTGNNNGQLNGAVHWVPGKYGSALMFDGHATDNVSVGTGLNNLPVATITAWVTSNTSDPNVFTSIISKSYGGAYSWTINWENVPAQLELLIMNGATYDNAASPLSFTPQRWYHIAGTWNGTNVKLYVDGVLRSSITQRITPQNSAYAVRIGSNGAVPAYSTGWNGTIDEVRILNVARSMTTA